MNEKKCFRCVYLAILLFLFMYGCSTAVKSVDYYQACLNDAECVEEMKMASNVTNSAVTSAMQSNSNTSSVAQIVGGVAGSVVAYFVGVVRGKKIKKG